MSVVTIDQHLATAVAALRGLTTDHSLDELRRRVGLAEGQEWTCTWCGGLLRPSAIGAGHTDVDHVIPLSRGGPRAGWDRELLHSTWNRVKGKRMTARAWELAAAHGIAVLPPDPLVLHRALQTVADGLRRIDWALTDF